MNEESGATETSEPTEKSGTFLVREADAASALLVSVDDGQVHTLSSNPGVDVDDVIEGTVAAEPPLAVTWTLVSVEERRSIAVEHVGEPVAVRAREMVPETPGELARESTDDGELHVLAVESGGAGEVAAEIVADPGTRERAARLGASRVEVRTGDDFVSVRYV